VSSPRPDGLGLRQTPDARVIQVRPYRARPRAATVIGIGVASLLVWGIARPAMGPTERGLVGAVVVALWVAAGLAWWWGTRRAHQRLEVYVGDHRLALVWSHEGEEQRRQEVDLTTVRETVARAAGVEVFTDGASWLLPMEGHTDEAIAWMVEHLREAGRGARKRA